MIEIRDYVLFNIYSESQKIKTVFRKILIVGTWETAQWGRCSLHKCEDQGSDPSAFIKTVSMVSHSAVSPASQLVHSGSATWCQNL